MKQCTKCKEFKEIMQFNKNKNFKDGHQYYCRKCDDERTTEYNRKVYGHISMFKNKECGAYLGIAVAEKLVRHLFENVVRMPNNNPGFDFICAKDKKIDVKSACIKLRNSRTTNKKYPVWGFHIEQNKTADYFLLLAFNNRADLEPLYMWLIPGHVLNELTSASIFPSTIHKWDEWRQDIDQARICCTALKG